MVKINIVGDIMLGDQFCSFGFGVRSMYENRYVDLISEDVVKILNNSDCLIGNLECSLNDDEGFKLATHVLSATTEGIRWLKKVGFDGFVLANNHSLERGIEVLKNHKKLIKNESFFYFGTSDIPMHIIEIKGKKIGLYAFTCIEDYKNTDDIEIYDETDTIKQVNKYANKVDYLIVFPHWGNEFIEEPSPEQVSLGKKLIEAGAKVVIGSHPHVLQPIEDYMGGLIIYSTGNFIFDSYTPETFHTACFQIQIDSNGKIDLEVVPIVSNKDYSLRKGNENESLTIKSKLYREPKNVKKEYYNNEVVVIRSKYRIETLKHILFNIWRFKDKIGFFSWGISRIYLMIKNRKQEKENPSSVYKWN